MSLWSLGQKVKLDFESVNRNCENGNIGSKNLHEVPVYLRHWIILMNSSIIIWGYKVCHLHFYLWATWYITTKFEVWYMRKFSIFEKEITTGRAFEIFFLDGNGGWVTFVLVMRVLFSEWESKHWTLYKLEWWKPLLASWRIRVGILGDHKVPFFWREIYEYVESINVIPFFVYQD